jgi:hypothetical protein
MTIELVIENTPESEMAPMPANAPAEFIEAALRTAQNSQHKARETILTDVCNVLGCSLNDLNFLFTQQALPHHSRPGHGLELPDYRMTLFDIYKEAAE